MRPIPVSLAVEDDLSDGVLRRVLSHVDRTYAVGTTYGKNGFGYLKSTVHGWNRAAVGKPFVLLTDLDSYACPTALIHDWLRDPLNPNLIFRVAVREVEAWLLADRENFSRFLRVRESAMPNDVETLVDPKATLVSLANRSPVREIRERIAPRRGSTAKQGPDYNGCLLGFVDKTWSISAASVQCRSLARTVEKLSKFQPVWPSLV